MRGSLFVTVVCGLIVNALDAPAQTAFNYDPSGNVVTLSNVAAIVPPAFLFTPRFASAESNGVLSVCAPITGVGQLSRVEIISPGKGRNSWDHPCLHRDATAIQGPKRKTHRV